MLKRVKLSSLRPNPWRHFETYEIVDEKIETLVESISETGFWKGQITARPADKAYEIAWGHHRWIAAKEALGEEAFIQIIVDNLTDDDMLRRMARENNEVYAPSAAQDVELVKAALEGHVDGRIHLPKNTGSGPNIDPSAYISVTSGHPNVSREQLAKYLGLHLRRVADGLANLKAIHDEMMEPEVLAHQTPRQSRDFTKEVRRVASTAGKETARQFAKDTAEKLKKKEVIASTHGRGSDKSTFRHEANKTISKAEGEDQSFKQFKGQFVGVRDKGNTFRIALFRLVDEMREMGVQKLRGPEVMDFNRMIQDVQEALNYYNAQFGNKPNLKVVSHDAD